MQTAPKKIVNAWAMYDWANSSYNLVITSTIFPEYFAAITGDGNENTIRDTVHFGGREYVNSALYNYALAIAFLVVALISPLLSSIADFRGNKKKFMGFFLAVGSLSCAGLYFFDGLDTLTFGLLFMILACIGYWGSVVFYNSFLPEIAALEDRDRISAKGFAFGYMGSVILQIICFVFVIQHEWFKITEGEGSRISFLLVGVWWLLFGLNSLRRLPKPIPAGTGDLRHQIFSKGYSELRKVWNQVKQLPILKRYLGAFFFYNMGVQTVMLAATLYGKIELQIPTMNLIISILLIQLIAIPGALVISNISRKVGNFRALVICVIVWIGICVAGYLLPRKGIYEFYALAAVVGFVMGGIQSLSRSTYAKLMPETNNTASFFSFYDVTEKIAIVIGMFSFGFINDITGSQRSSVLVLMTYFIIGLILLALVINKSKSQISESRAL